MSFCADHDKLSKIDDKVNTNFRGLNVPEDGVKRESFTILSTDYLLAYESKYYRPVYVDNSAYKIVNMQMTNFFDNNLFESDES